MDQTLGGGWPDSSPLVRRELGAFLATAAEIDPTLPTRCRPWTAADVTTHVGESFARFTRMLEQGRRGDLTPPFAKEEMDAENLRAVVAFDGDPVRHLESSVNAFLRLVDDPDEIMPHQRGPIPVGLQLQFGLGDLAVHHDDIAVAAGSSYTPEQDVVDMLVDGYRRLGSWGPVDEPVWELFVEGRGE